MTSSNSRVYEAIVLKFSTKQINLITKKSAPAICEIMNIIVDLRIFVNASHSVFLKKHQNTNKTKTFFFWKSWTSFCRECYDFDMCHNLVENINVWSSWSSWKLFLGLKTTWFLGTHILWIFDNPRFNNWFKSKRDRKIRVFEDLLNTKGYLYYLYLSHVRFNVLVLKIIWPSSIMIDQISWSQFYDGIVWEVILRE